VGSFFTRYKFNAKEQDSESDLYYYGARYYDPKTSVWLGVDPMADKYPGLSPFVFCANNPVILVDPDGKTFELFDKPGGKSITYSPNMKVPAGASKFVSDAITGLNFLYNNPEGNNNRVGQIATSEISIKVLPQTPSNSSTYNGENRTLRWDNQSADVYKDGIQSPIIALAHEIDHASVSVNGWESMYRHEGSGDTKSTSYYESVSNAYMTDSQDKSGFEKSAINYENFIGNLTFNGKKLATFKRPSHIPPLQQIKVESIFSTGE